LGLENLALPSAGLIALTSLFQLLVRKWWISIILLAIQYVGVFILIGLEWPLEMAVTALIAGWIASAILAMAILSTPTTDIAHPLFYDPMQTLSIIFYLLSAIFMGIMVSSATPTVSQWIPGIGAYQAWGGLILAGLGFLRICFNSYPMSIISGLLTLLSGFEILYAPIENSAYVVGTLAAFTLGLAMVGAYLQIAPSMEENH